MGAHPRDPGWPWRCAWLAGGRESGYLLLPAAGAQGTPFVHSPCPEGHLVSFGAPILFSGAVLATFDTFPYLTPKGPTKFVPLNAHYTEEKAEAQSFGES